MDIPSYLLGRIKGSGGAGVSYIVVEELPTTGEEGKIYLVPKSTSQTENVYNEYMYIEDEWELIGDTQADLTDYLKEEDLKTINGNSIVGSGDLSIEPKYITDGDGNKLYFTRYSTDDTYKQNVFFPALEQLIEDFDNGKKSFIYIGEEYTGQDYIPTSDYRSSIFFIQRVSSYPSSDTKQYYVKSTQVGPIKMNGAFQMQRTYYDGYINYVISTGKVSSININNTKEAFISILRTDNTSSYTPTGDYNPATKKYVDDNIQITQYETLPTASESNEGKIAQYIGTTDSNYTNGYFYQVVSDGEDPATYSWENIQVQAGGGSSAPRYIEDENGNKLYFIVKDSNFDGPAPQDTNIGNIVKLMYQDYLSGYNPAVVITEKTKENGQYASSPSNITNAIYTIYKVYGKTIELISTDVQTSYSYGGSTTVGGYVSLLNTRYCYKITFTDNTFSEVQSVAPAYYNFNPNQAYQFYTKSSIDNINPKGFTGYDATKTQVLKNINGTLQWVTEE